MEFGGIAVGILALICALVLLFGQRGTRRVLGWGAVAIIAAVALFASGAVFYAWTDAGVTFYFWTVETLKTAQGYAIGAAILALICTLFVLPFGLRGARVLITVIAAAAIFYAGVTVQSHYTVLSDAQVGLTSNNQPAWKNAPVVAPPPPGFVLDQPAQTATVVPAPKSKPGMFDDLIPNAAPKSGSISKPYEQLIAEEDQRIAWTNSRTPIKLEGPIKLTHVSRSESLETVEYEIALAADKWTDDHRADLTRITTNENCDNRETRKMLDAGFRIKHVFRDQGGILGYSITITKYSCSQVSN
jgi:hypothetical protein